MSPEHGVAGIVLAGGRSKRLGQDKAQVLFRGECLLGRALGLARSFCPKTWVVGRDPADPEQGPGVTAPWLPDDTPGLGPAGGIATALRRLARPCLVLSCDMPLLEAFLLDRLFRIRAEAGQPGPDGPVCTLLASEASGRLEPLAAIYEVTALPLLEAGLARGDGKLSRIIGPEQRRPVFYSSAEESCFLNINRLEDLAALRVQE